MAAKPILVLVEQDTQVGRTLRGGLEEWFDVRLAAGLTHALQLIGAECVDGLVIDAANHHDLDNATLATIHQIDKNLPVLVCSANEPPPAECTLVRIKRGMSFTDLAREIKRAMIPYQVNRIYTPLRNMLSDSLKTLDEMKLIGPQP